MNNPAEQFIATNKANLETLNGLATQAFAGVEKLVELNMAASKAILAETSSHLQAVLGARDAQELLALQSGMAKPLAEKFAAYGQQVQSIMAASSAELTKSIETKSAETQQAFADAMENLARNAPAGTESAIAAFKSVLSASQDAVESAQTSAKKAVAAAQSNFTAAATQAADAVKKAAKAA